MYGGLHRDEIYIWTDANVKMAGKVLKHVCKVLCETHPRVDESKEIADFPEPWCI